MNNKKILRSFAPTNVSHSFNFQKARWDALLLISTLTVFLQINSRLFLLPLLLFSDIECLSYNLVLWIDGFVPVPFWRRWLWRTCQLLSL